ncbi:thiolase-like protein [Corynascus similis CBS 632.67]
MAPHADETNENGTNGTKGTNKANGTSGVHGTSDVHSTSPIPGLWITGIASQYPPYLLGPEKLNEFTWRFFDVEEPGLKKLLQTNKTSGIETRASIGDYQSGIADLDTFYRRAGVDLAAQACRKAMREWGGRPSDITHTVAVTRTDQGNPGYDLLVARRLGLPHTVDRTLLHGVGCAGGLAIMRAAVQIASGATARSKPARVLVFACELCTPNVRHDLAEAEACADPADVSIAGVLLADGAAAFVLCNDLGLELPPAEPLFQLLECGNQTLPNTLQHMGFYAESTGFRTVLTRDVPSFTKMAIEPMFSQLLPSFWEKVGLDDLSVAAFDWALHRGGEAIIHGAQAMLHLTNEQLRATREIYRTRGNSSSPTVLAVLDLLQKMGRGKDHIVATSFGPGLAIEMSLFRRCRDE